MGIDGISKELASEWDAITHAPALFLAAILVTAVLIWKLIQREYGTRILNAISTIALREAQLQEYKDKLSGATPDEAKARIEALEQRFEQFTSETAAWAPRRLSDRQKDRAGTYLDRFHGSRITVFYVHDADDAAIYAMQFERVFNACGWIVQRAGVSAMPNPSSVGLCIYVNDKNRLTSAQSSITEYFRDIGLVFEILEDMLLLPGQTAPEAQISISKRPMD